MKYFALVAALSLGVVSLGGGHVARADVTPQGQLPTVKATVFGTVTAIQNVIPTAADRPLLTLTLRKILDGNVTVEVLKSTKFRSFQGRRATVKDLRVGSTIQVVGFRTVPQPEGTAPRVLPSRPIEATHITILVE